MTSSDTDIRDEDRLPWLETVDHGVDDPPSALRLVVLVVLGIAILAAAILGYAWYQRHHVVAGTGALIAAQEGDYKVRPDAPGGIKVAEEGDSAISTSNGASGSDGRIDLASVPETPVLGTRAGGSPARGGARQTVAAIPASGGRLAPAAAAPTPIRPAGGGSALVQIGSFPDAGSANAAWAAASRRFSYLAPLGKAVERAEVAGRTVYRLRVNAGSAGAATILCGKLKVAGEACFVVRD